MDRDELIALCLRVLELNEKATPAPWSMPLNAAGEIQVGANLAGPPFIPVAGCGCCGSPFMSAGEKSKAKADADASLIESYRQLAPDLAWQLLLLLDWANPECAKTVTSTTSQIELVSSQNPAPIRVWAADRLPDFLRDILRDEDLSDVDWIAYIPEAFRERYLGFLHCDAFGCGDTKVLSFDSFDLYIGSHA